MSSLSLALHRISRVAVSQSARRCICVYISHERRRERSSACVLSTLQQTALRLIFDCIDTELQRTCNVFIAAKGVESLIVRRCSTHRLSCSRPGLNLPPLRSTEEVYLAQRGLRGIADDDGERAALDVAPLVPQQDGELVASRDGYRIA